MKKISTKISADEQFQKDILASMERYYRQALSENAKRAWQKRKEKLSTMGKVVL